MSRPAPGSAAPVVNALTIDVEDYFQVSALAHRFPRESWDRIPLRVEQNMDRILDMLDRHGVKATFFTLGYVARRCPDLVRRIVRGGHELASHGFHHQRASELSPAALREDLHAAKNELESISGSPVVGYRAPSFSIGEQNTWAFDCIADTGHRYSSSVYPIRHDHYGMPDAPRIPHRTAGGLLEIPMTTATVLGRTVPAAGGGYFRLLPYAVSRWLIRRVNQVERRPAMFYFHPWEIDPAQPRPRGLGPKTRFRHYVNLSRTAPRLERLLADFRWARVDQVFLKHEDRA